MAEPGAEVASKRAYRALWALYLLGAVLLVAVVVAVWNRSRSSSEGRRAPAPRVEVAVERGRLAFSAPELRVPIGGVGVFRNEDSVEHTFTADGGLFDSGPVAPGKSFTFSFPAAGELTYHCEIHPSMKGRVVVEAEG